MIKILESSIRPHLKFDEPPDSPENLLFDEEEMMDESVIDQDTSNLSKMELIKTNFKQLKNKMLVNQQKKKQM